MSPTEQAMITLTNTTLFYVGFSFFHQRMEARLAKKEKEA